VSNVLHFVSRTAMITIVGAIALLAYAVRRIPTLFIRDGAARADAVAHLRGRHLRWVMERLGATFIKLGQVMSTRPDLLAPGVIQELRKLQDAVPAYPFRRVRATIEADLGPLEQRFRAFDEQPVAAASVAQVHRAERLDGAEVAVKVLRPGVRRLVEQDAHVLRFWARVMALHPRARLSDPVGHLEELIAGIREQTDLSLEAANYKIFHDNFRDFEGVFFPEVYPDACSSRVLTMTFLRGTKLDRLDPGGDHRALGQRLHEMFMKMCFVDNFLHCDLHPGNSMLTESGDVAVFDVGLVKRLDGPLFDEFVDWNRCLAMGEASDFVTHMQRYHHYLDGVDWGAMAVDIDRFVKHFRAQSMAEMEWGVLINEVFALARKYNVRPRTEIVLILVGTVTAEGVGKILNPELNAIEAMGRFLLPIVMERQMLQAAS
jgi:ubiquinone biosynthesis protein